MKYIRWIEDGRLAVRAGPGCKPWNLDELWKAGFRRIISLDTKNGLDAVAIKKRGIEHRIVRLDDSPPNNPAIQAAYFAVIDEVLAVLESDGLTPKQTLVHCYAGLDRSPTVGICYLISTKVPPDDAIWMVCKKTGPFGYTDCIRTIREWHRRRTGTEQK